MKCLVCVNVPSECSQCQALMTGAPETVCVCQGVFSRDSDRLRSSVERSRPRYTLKIHTHTHTESSGVFRVSVWFGAYHYTLQGKPGLTKADWHCQELWEQSDLIYIRAPSCCCCCCCVKCFFVGKSLPQQSWRSGVGAASMKLEEAASPTMEKLHSPDQS